MDKDINLSSQVDHKCDMFGLKTGCKDLYKICTIMGHDIANA